MASKDDDRDPQDDEVDEYGKTTMMVSPFFQKPEAKPSGDVPVEEQRTQIGRVEDLPAPPSRVTVQPQARQPQQQQRSSRSEPREEPRELPRSREQTGRPQAIQRQPEKKPPIALFIAAGILLLGGGVGLGVLLMSASGKPADSTASVAANPAAQATPPAPTPSAAAIPTPVPAEPSAAPTVGAPTPSAQAEPSTPEPPTAASSLAIPPPKAPDPVVQQQKAPEPTEPEEKVVAAKPEPKSKPVKKPSAKADKGSVVVVQGPDDEDQPAPGAKAKKKARLVIKAPPGVQVQIDNKPFGMTPLASPIELDAGQCFVTLIAPDGRKKGYAVELEGGETQTLSETF